MSVGFPVLDFYPLDDRIGTVLILLAYAKGSGSKIADTLAFLQDFLFLKGRKYSVEMYIAAIYEEAVSNKVYLLIAIWTHWIWFPYYLWHWNIKI